MFNFINPMRNKFTHNPYGLFDENDALKIKTILMRQKVFNHLLINSVLPRDLLDDSLCCAYALVEAVLKNKYRGIHAAKLFTERITKLLGAMEKPGQRIRKEAFYKQVEDELKVIYLGFHD